MNEPSIDHLPRLAARVWAAIATTIQGPWALLGHSMGGAVAWEVAHLATRAGKAPEHLFLSARRAPDQPAPHPPMFPLPDGAFVEAVQRAYGPFPDILKRPPGLLKAFLPTLRADLKALDTHQPTRAPLALPTSLRAGASDHSVPPAAVRAWSSFLTGPVEARTFPGGHFYLRDAPEGRAYVAEVLQAWLLAKA